MEASTQPQISRLPLLQHVPGRVHSSCDTSKIFKGHHCGSSSQKLINFHQTWTQGLFFRVPATTARVFWRLEIFFWIYWSLAWTIIMCIINNLMNILCIISKVNQACQYAIYLSYLGSAGTGEPNQTIFIKVMIDSINVQAILWKVMLNPLISY